MAKKGGVSNRSELLERWRVIEDRDNDDNNDPHSTTLLKEPWFSDTFNFLVYLVKDDHIWCGASDLMGPLLETFFNYFNDNSDNSPLKLLWKRISEEMRQCTQCILQHHQARDMYAAEYEWSSIGPLLNVLQSLDEERITWHLREMNLSISKGHYDPVRDHAEVISVMFEVLMYPILLEDQALATEFQIFVEAIDDAHELALAGHQQYPGIYALFFSKSRRARTIGLRLAGNMGKLRRATDLDPLQPMLKNVLAFWTEIQPPAVQTSRPRAWISRTSGI